MVEGWHCYLGGKPHTIGPCHVRMKCQVQEEFKKIMVELDTQELGNQQELGSRIVELQASFKTFNDAKQTFKNGHLRIKFWLVHRNDSRPIFKFNITLII